ncbi:uncharacterized protein LOC105764314 [Gossypium raimondii]|uniref:uncharacterized protein LOC105764314 n=1 Tax=Gossypium raimondii TaxID=29730 RepID=UPI00063AEBD8|nr:uncharacterized protein LOC105764314 [Gossypium raimondii]
MVSNASISDSTSGSDVAGDVGVVNGQQAPLFTQAQCQQILNLLNNEHVVEVVASLADLSSGKMKGIGREQDGFYIQQPFRQTKVAISTPITSLSANVEPSFLWHTRLDHASVSRLNKVINLPSTVSNSDSIK